MIKLETSLLGEVAGETKAAESARVTGTPRKQIPAVGVGAAVVGELAYRWDLPEAPKGAAAPFDPIAEASQALLIAAEATLGKVERSNAFDRWRALLDEAAGNALLKGAYCLSRNVALLSTRISRFATRTSPRACRSKNSSLPRRPGSHQKKIVAG